MPSSSFLWVALLTTSMIACAAVAQGSSGSRLVPTADTVGQLLRLDSAIALERMREKLPPPTLPATSGPANSLRAASAPTGGPIAPQIDVLAILGVADHLRADIAINGRLYRLLRVGQVVDKWTLTQIRGRCVRLSTLDPTKALDGEQCFADVGTRPPAAQPTPLARALTEAQPLPVPAVPTPPPYTPAPAPALRP